MLDSIDEWERLGKQVAKKWVGLGSRYRVTSHYAKRKSFAFHSCSWKYRLKTRYFSIAAQKGGVEMRTVPCKIYYSSEDDCWYVESPGFYDGIMTYGKSFEDAYKMAAEAVSGLMASYLKHGDRYTIPEKPFLDVDWYDIPLLTMQTQTVELISA